MNSSENIQSAEETHDFEVSSSDGASEFCPNHELMQRGEQHEWDEGLGAYRVSFLFECVFCGESRLTPEEEL